jgi:hypothetical protein
MILDGGGFRFFWLCLSIPFWVAAAILSCLRKQPTAVERLVVAIWPLLLFFGMFFVGNL